MENVGAFLDAIKAMGVPEPSLCTTADLYNGSGMPQVRFWVLFDKHGFCSNLRKVILKSFSIEADDACVYVCGIYETQQCSKLHRFLFIN